jgi:hypothetical protein
MTETRKQGAGTEKAKNKKTITMIFCVESWMDRKTDSKCNEQSQPKPKHAPNAIQQVSNAPNVDKKSSRKVCLFWGESLPRSV